MEILTSPTGRYLLGRENKYLISRENIVSPFTKGLLYNWWSTQDQVMTMNYGYLYNYYAATDMKNIANTGWHVPLQADMQTLVTYLGGNSVAGGKLKETGLTRWNAPNTDATDIVGFSARPGGRRNHTGEFMEFFLNMWLWLADELQGQAVGVVMSNVHGAISSPVALSKNSGLSLRLVKDTTTLTHGQQGIYYGIDGKLYHSVCIGSQEWLAENLMETRYRDGSLIPYQSDSLTWAGISTGARCSYNNLQSTAATLKRLAPSGWHLPSDSEWNQLSAFLGGDSMAGAKMKQAEFINWEVPNTGADNNSGFTALGSGQREDITGYGNFTNFNQRALYWSNTPSNFPSYFIRMLQNDSSALTSLEGSPTAGFSVRLVKDTSYYSIGETLTDVEGNIYPTVKIGDQVWLSQNFKCTRFNDGSTIDIVSDAQQWISMLSPAVCVYNGNWDNK